ncbi:MAG: LVIVD repeat-containing protein [Candidatus Hodarchaeales archaeon]|jgi:hypothetical protein
MNEKSISVITVLLIIQVCYLPGMLITASEPSDWKITEISRIGTGRDAYSLLVEDDYCYITCGYDGFKIFDVSDRFNPEIVADFPQLDDGYAHQFVLNEGIAYIGNGYGGIWIINCTDPENPSVITNYRHDYSWDIQIKDGILLSGNGHISAQESITITNISDLFNPVHIDTVLTDDDITDLEIVDNKLFAAGSHEGLLVYDITNMTNLIPLGNFTDQMNPDLYLVSLEVVEDIIYAGYYEYGLKILNASNVSNITQVAEFQNSSGNYYSLKEFNDYLYISDISNGFKILDIDIRTDPVEVVSHYYDNCGTNDIFRRENTLFVADRSHGLVIFNIGDLTINEGISGFEFLLVICLFSLLWMRRKY